VQGVDEGQEPGEPGRPTDRGWDVVKGMSAFGQAVGAIVRAFDPSLTLVVHCGNGFDAGQPYQSTRLSRYNAGP
jgi:hypothetical protein